MWVDAIPSILRMRNGFW